MGPGMRLVVLSDTHVPVRARDLPAEVWRAAAGADAVIHAGDWLSEDLVTRLADACGGRLTAVYGNNDPPAVRRLLPEVAWLRAGGLAIAVVHETGAATGRERRSTGRFPDADVLVFGHSHIPWDTSVASPGSASGCLRLLNPGSPTDRRRQPYPSYLTARAADGGLTDVVLHRLPLPPSRPHRGPPGGPLA